MEAAGGAGVRDGDRHVAGEGAIDGELCEYGAGTSDGGKIEVTVLKASQTMVVALPTLCRMPAAHTWTREEGR